ncbi:MAG: hypothetical protein HQM09_07825 [Candidatus Riflebacteria bacterium]|nr:hypothetical protein [Candidatus Riflebacteria bacterium]
MNRKEKEMNSLIKECQEGIAEQEAKYPSESACYESLVARAKELRADPKQVAEMPEMIEGLEMFLQGDVAGGYRRAIAYHERQIATAGMNIKFYSEMLVAVDKYESEEPLPEKFKEDVERMRESLEYMKYLIIHETAEIAELERVLETLAGEGYDEHEERNTQ